MENLKIRVKNTHETHPGMPTVPRVKDSGSVSGHSASSLSKFFPSEMECVVQPKRATTIVPVGKAAFLLSITLKRKHTETRQSSSLPRKGRVLRGGECPQQGTEVTRRG